MLNGTLFTEAFLGEGICDTLAWKSLAEPALSTARAEIEKLFAAFPVKGNPTEAQTEKDLIWPLLEVVGWGPDTILVQPNLSVKGRKQVPDALLFSDAVEKSKANKEAEPWKRVRFGRAHDAALAFFVILPGRRPRDRVRSAWWIGSHGVE